MPGSMAIPKVLMFTLEEEVIFDWDVDQDEQVDVYKYAKLNKKSFLCHVECNTSTTPGKDKTASSSESFLKL